MNARYPWISMTFLIAIVYGASFCLMYMLAGMTYSLFSQVPADQSRNISAIYYGAVFTVIPFAGLGLYAPARYMFRYIMHALVVAFLVEKGIIVFLATLLASGFPASWYGHAFPAAGFGVLCEEFPFYCTPYVWKYIGIGTLISAVSLYAGSLLGARLAQPSTP
ncbi:hypothetical protein ACFQI7_06095 [Paenibacillus allorhizosphaerae]|uniref:Uncharacterized protein n=1 Tax=Paenibacillus allorhizosphaerae TaxID=2849866 RepID=A0ABN7TM26_9BACL|nr:hypothetical protein [Paenibacillus allorhizosphaerae]CAG7634512.1 hypothetical protein PAECIP111802_02036 [Paenibacillus allorhizosphaerae]